MYTYNILEQLQVKVEVESNPFGLPLERLFQMAARINPKRSFLFVSRVLGKHLAVDPYVSLLSGAALSLLLYRELEQTGANDTEETSDPLSTLLPDILKALMTGEDAREAYERLMETGLVLTKPVSFIGFAETATALGHSMYAPFRGQASYVHTTRHDVAGLTPVITFEEEHSHAVSHRCYALDADMIAGQQPIVLVDDEVTTGKTTLNIIRALHERYPRPTYYIASLLDWRSEQHVQRYAELEQELDITIVPLSLVKGRITVDGQAQLVHPPFAPIELDESVPVTYTELDDVFQQLSGYPSVDGAGIQHHAPFVRWTGRFGLTSEENAVLEQGIRQTAHQLCALRKGTNTLCLGTEEFMYIPMRIAAEMGEGMKYHSTTRSPVYRTAATDYAIYSGNIFPSPEDSSVNNYVYNIPFGGYDDVFVFLERSVPDGHLDGLLNVLRSRGFKQVNVVICGLHRDSQDEGENGDE